LEKQPDPHPEIFDEFGKKFVGLGSLALPRNRLQISAKKTAHPSLRYGKAIAREKHGGAGG